MYVWSTDDYGYGKDLGEVVMTALFQKGFNFLLDTVIFGEGLGIDLQRKNVWRGFS